MQMTMMNQIMNPIIENRWIGISIFIFLLWCLTIWRLDCRIRENQRWKAITKDFRGLSENA